MPQELIAPDSSEAHERILKRIRAFTAEDLARMDAREAAANDVDVLQNRPSGQSPTSERRNGRVLDR